MTQKRDKKLIVTLLILAALLISYVGVRSYFEPSTEPVTESKE